MPNYGLASPLGCFFAVSVVILIHDFSKMCLWGVFDSFLLYDFNILGLTNKTCLIVAIIDYWVIICYLKKFFCYFSMSTISTSRTWILNIRSSTADFPFSATSTRWTNVINFTEKKWRRIPEKTEKRFLWKVSTLSSSTLHFANSFKSHLQGNKLVYI